MSMPNIINRIRSVATQDDINSIVTESVLTLKTTINNKFGCDIDSSAGNVAIQGNFTADAVYGAVWNEEE